MHLWFSYNRFSLHLRRGFPAVLLEEFTEIVGVVVANGVGDFFDGEALVFQQLFGAVQPDLDEVVDGADSHAVLEGFRQIGGADEQLFCQGVQGDVLFVVGLQVVNGVIHQVLLAPVVG